MAMADDTGLLFRDSEEVLNSIDDAYILAYANSAYISVETAERRIHQEEVLITALTEIGITADAFNYDIWIDELDGELALFVRSDRKQTLDVLFPATERAGMRIVVDPQQAFLVSRTEQAHAKVAEMIERIPGLMGFYIDVALGKLVLDVYEASHGLGVTSGSEAAEVALLAEEITGLPSIVVTLPAPAHDTAAVNGGVTLSVIINGQKTPCTAGFTATYSTGGSAYQGFLSAAHCGKSVSYYYGTSASGTLTAATYRTGTQNANADIAFFSVASGDSVVNKFFGESTTSTTTHGPPACAILGATACGRGAKSGYSCGKVDSLTYTPTWPQACGSVACKPVFAKTNRPTKGGDSGGPVWVSTNRPVGIHKGGSEGGLFGIGSYSVYSKLDYLPAGVSIK